MCMLGSWKPTLHCSMHQLSVFMWLVQHAVYHHELGQCPALMSPTNGGSPHMAFSSSQPLSVTLLFTFAELM